jgi:hypothetical protein
MALDAAKAFHGLVHEFKEDMELLDMKHQQLVAARQALLREATRALWPAIVAPFGLDPLKTFGDGSTGLDCAYIDHGIAVLSTVDQSAQPDPIDDFALAVPVPGSRLN